MGGRGASIGRGAGYTSNLGFGPAGAPIPIDSILTNTNPHYDEDEKWRKNCQRCVVAYEMQRRGYAVEAKPRVLKGNDPLDNGNWKNVFEGMRWTPQGNPTSSDFTVQKNIERNMSNWGDGSRAIVHVVWADYSGAHVFNVEQIKGKTRAFDAQSGKEVQLSDYLSYADSSLTEIARVDNLNISANLVGTAVKKRRH